MENPSETPTPRRPAADVSEQEFEEFVAEGLDLVPSELMDRLSNVVFLVEEEPRPDQLDPEAEACDCGCSGDLLGLYEGTPLTERTEWWAAGSLPDVITIFRGPTLRFCEFADEVAEEVAVTVVHEIAHHFGIEDDELHELGWS